MNALHCFGCFLAVSVVMVHSACVPIPGHYTKRELVGSYQIDYPFGRDVFILREDGTYEQRFPDKSGKIFTNKRKWTLIPRRDNQVQLSTPFLSATRLANSPLRLRGRVWPIGLLAGTVAPCSPWART